MFSFNSLNLLFHSDIYYRFFWILIYITMKYTNNGGLYFSLQSFYQLFSCLTALSRTSNTILNRKRDIEHHYLIFDFREKAFNIPPLTMMLAQYFLLMPF